MGRQLRAALAAGLVLAGAHGVGPVPAEGAPKPSDAPPQRAAEAAGPVQPLAVEPSVARTALAAVPPLARLAPAFEFFTNADVDAALRRGGRSRDGITLWTFLPSSFTWSPSPTRQFWVLSGRSGSQALVVVLERRDGGYVHAASTIVTEPETTIAIGHSAQYPTQLVFTTCYGCPGEGGAIVLREDGRVVFTYR
jgi:hypothetical protein